MPEWLFLPFFCRLSLFDIIVSIGPDVVYGSRFAVRRQVVSGGAGGDERQFGGVSSGSLHVVEACCSCSDV